MLNIKSWMAKVTQTLAEIKHTTYIPGQIMMYAGPIVQSVSNNKITTTAPTGHLLCDGSIILVADYPELAAALGSTYGGDGTTTFGLPNFCGRVGVGVGESTATGHTDHTLGQKAGNENAIIPYHRHSIAERTISGGSHDHKLGRRNVYAATGSAVAVVTYGGGTANDSETGSASHSHTIAEHNTAYAGTSGNTTGANMMPYIGINYIIATGKTN